MKELDSKPVRAMPVHWSLKANQALGGHRKGGIQGKQGVQMGVQKATPNSEKPYP